MKKLSIILVGIVLINVFIGAVWTQPVMAQSISSDSIVQLTAETRGLPLISPTDLPARGTFWIVLPGRNGGLLAPAPCPPENVSAPIYRIAGNIFLADATAGQNTTTNAMLADAAAVVNLIEQVQAPQARRMMALDGGPMPPGAGGGGDATNTYAFNGISFDTNSLYLEISAVTAGWVQANLHHSSNEVYAIWGTTNLAAPFSAWQVETEVWPTNSATMPFALPTQDRQTLFLKAEDWTGVDSDFDGVPDWWVWKFFGDLSHNANDADSLGINSLWYDYANGLDPNIINFSLSFPNQYAGASIIAGLVTVSDGNPASMAVLVDNTNFAAAAWTAYSSNVTVNLGSTQGAHEVRVGLRGLPADAQQTWQETTLILDSAPPAITITNPANHAAFNSSRVNVGGNFAAGTLKQITVNGTLAFIHGTNFDALNVPLDAGSNLVVATVETLSGLTNMAIHSLVTLTNGDGSLNDPVQLQATPVAGFSPLPVVFQIQTHLPGTFQQAAYDFNGDDLADFITNNLNSITHTYATNGEYYPVVTLQTTAGSFSSVGGWNAVAAADDSQPVQINVQLPPTVSAFANIADPVDLKWDGANLYVLSRSTATLTEFDAAGSTLRSVTHLGLNPSGFDVDAGGNVYVAVTGSNQVWKLYPTATSFAPDGGFGYAGMIGTAGTGDGEFNAPFDVAVSPDGGTIAISDSGNHRLQWIDSSGNFMNALGSHGAAIGQFDTPKGLVYDAIGTLYVADSGNHRLVTVSGGAVQGIAGTNGTALGQFNEPVNLSVGARGVYVADTGNNRIQAFDAPEAGTFSITPGGIRYAVATNFSQPYAVAAVNNATNDQFYVADTGNNRVMLCTAPNTDADALQAVWQHMTARVAAADIPGAVADFSVATAEQYRQAFLSVGTGDLISTISQIGTLTPVSINGDQAEYDFTDTIGGETVTFPVEFSRENGVWKILEF